MVLRNNCPALLVGLALSFGLATGADDEYNVLHRDGSFEFGYNNPDSYHYADANRNNVVRGEFGGRNPGTGAIDSTVYTAGPRGYRPRGKNVVRKYDLNQSGPRPVGSRDDPNFDPYEDPSYSFGFRTRTYNREESANRAGDVNGRYSYVDDVGERHNVEFVAGKSTGFHVKTPFPDSNPRAYGPLYFNGRGRPKPRGRTSIQRGTDGSYRFVSSGPDQRRTEVSDSTGHVRGSYTYLDDKGVQHSVHYIAGPETGYRVLKQVKGPHLPTVFPFARPEILPPDLYDDDVPKDLFDAAASGRVTPAPAKGRPASGGSRPALGGGRPAAPGGNEIDGKPGYLDEDDVGDFGDLFGGGGGGKKPSTDDDDDDGDDGSYKPAPASPAPTTPEVDGYAGGPIPTPTFEEGPTTPRVATSSRPPLQDRAGEADDDDDGFGLFGSETGRPRPPSYATSAVALGCSRCPGGGTLVTNFGDRAFLVPPGVSVRAHVQAIDLVPISPSVPSPSEQYRAELHRKTEQLNAAEDSIVGRNDTSKAETSSKEEVEATTTTTSTTTVATTTTTAQSKSNSTSGST